MQVIPFLGNLWKPSLIAPEQRCVRKYTAFWISGNETKLWPEIRLPDFYGHSVQQACCLSAADSCSEQAVKTVESTK